MHACILAQSSFRAVFSAVLPLPCRWKWSYLVADEAHALKNRSSIRTRKLRKLAACCENRILLTGGLGLSRAY